MMVGRADPAIIAVSQRIGQLGWRVSSIYRPTGTHQLGVSMDVCPQVWHKDGPNENNFHLKTAKMIWTVAKDLRPDKTWIALSEDDHVHLQLSRGRDLLGVQKHGHGPVMYTVDTLQKVPLTMSHLRDLLNPYGGLPENPVGDFTLDLGDVLDLRDVDTGDVGYGIFNETGGPRVVKPTRLAAKYAAKGVVPAKQINTIAKENPQAAAKIVADAQIKKANRVDWLKFEFAEACTILNSNLGLNVTLKHWEVAAIKAIMVAIPPVEPKVIPLTQIAPGSTTWTVQLDKVLSTLFGLADGFLFPYIGVKLMIAASDLNRTRGANITMQRSLLAPYISATMNVELAHDTNLSPMITAINGAIVSGHARFTPTFIPVLAAGTANWNVTIIDLPTTYTPSLRLLMPADGQAEKLFNLL